MKNSAVLSIGFIYDLKTRVHISEININWILLILLKITKSKALYYLNTNYIWNHIMAEDWLDFILVICKVFKEPQQSIQEFPQNNQITLIDIEGNKIQMNSYIYRDRKQISYSITPISMQV